MRALVIMLMTVMMVAVGAISYATEDLLALTNADRSRNGLALLTGTSELQAYAQGRAEEMMRAGALWHTANLMAALPNSLSVGENVGRGPSLTDIESAFMASPSHRANVLRPGYSEAGVGVVWDGVEQFYVAVIFRQPPAAAPPVAMPAPVPTAKPAPAPRPTSSPPTTARRPEPAPRPTSRPPTTARPEPAPAPRAVMSTPTTAPPPSPPPEPAGVDHRVPLAREAGPRLRWVLEATTGESVLGSDAPDGISPAPLVAASTSSAAEDGSSSLLLAMAFLGVVYALTRILAEAHRRFVPGVRS